MSAEFLTIREIIINGTLNIGESSVNTDMDLHIPAIEMLNFIEKKIDGNVLENEKRTLGIFLSISKASIDYAKNVLKDPILKDRHEPRFCSRKK